MITLLNRFPVVAVAVVASFALVFTGAPSADSGLVAPSVHAQGTGFVDANGDSIVLRGFDVPVGDSPSLWAKAVDLGANFVRLPVYWNEIEPKAPVGGVHSWNTSYLNALDSEVSYFGSHGVYALIDFHQVDWSPYFRSTSRGIPAWYYADGRFPATEKGLAQAKGAWWTTESARSLAAYSAYVSMMVQRYSAFANVVGYDLFNEPQPGSLGSIASATQSIISWQASMLATIRQLDAQRTVFLSPRQGGDLGLLNADLSPLGSLQNVAIDLHTYFTGLPGTGYSADGEDWSPSWDATHNQNFTDYHGTLDQQETTFLIPYQRTQELGIPLLVGEWGAKNADSGLAAYQSQMLQLFAKYNVNWTRWDLSSNRSLGVLTGNGSYGPAALQLQQVLEGGSPSTVQTPSATGGAAIWGIVKDGRPLVAQPGTWAGTPPFTFSYQWQRCDGSGSDCLDIPGADAPIYTVSTVDLGSTLSVRVTAANPSGSQTVSSVASGSVGNDPPAILGPPTVSGTPSVGSTLDSDVGNWSGSQPMTFGYRWQRCSAGGKNCVNILGSAATGASYTLTSDDAGHEVRVKVKATNSAGSTNGNSVPTGVVSSG